jgi:signal transduction histidine kinase
MRRADQDLLRQRLQAQLGLPPEALRISLREADDGPALLRIALRTPAGLWVNTQQQPLITQGWVRPLRFSVPVSTLPVLLIVALFLRRILRPVNALAQAAERVSRGEEVAPLPLTGPQEAREVTAAFNLMQQRLRRFVEDRTRMLAAISHDLRTPITSLRLRAELVDDTALRKAMIRTLDEMRVMVEETVRFARDDAHTEVTREIDLANLLQELAQEHAEQGHDVQITVQKNARKIVQDNARHQPVARHAGPALSLPACASQAGAVEPGGQRRTPRPAGEIVIEYGARRQLVHPRR